MASIVGSRFLAGALGGLESSGAGPVSLEAFPMDVPPDHDVMTYAQFVVGLNRLETQLRQAEQGHPDVMACLEDPVASLAQSYLDETAERTGRRVPLATGGEEAVYDEKDYLGWGVHVYQWIGSLKLPHWPTPPDRPDRIPAKSRIAVLGDWGTGLYGAPVCARSIEQRTGDYQATIHLGDVYYSGTFREVGKQFLPIWPRVRGALRRAVVGNHEMYSGGHAYFDAILPAFGQESSCFAIENDDWLILGLDSAFKASRHDLFLPPDNDLYLPQIAWLEGQIERAGRKKVILLSHHQPFSYFDARGPTLVSRIRPLLEARRIFAWYWGHEHLCILYDQHPEWGLFGRCVGHGGYPYFRTAQKAFPGPPANRPGLSAPTESAAGWRWLPGRARDTSTPNSVPPGVVVDGPNPYVPGHENDYGPNGYMTLELDGPHLLEIVHDADGAELYREPLG